MNRTAADFRAVIESLFLSVSTGKRGQQGRMNIQNPPGKFADEIRAQNPHKARQANKVDMEFPERRHHLTVVCFAFLSSRWNQPGSKPHPACSLESGGFLAVADHHRDLGRNFSLRHIARNRLKIGAAPGNENSKIFHDWTRKLEVRSGI